ncbi:helix-turn-helix transcriptional regulator (plasmid) [Methylocystis parvus]|uniref:Helix-turn-helix transcriptional regulator n=1 Tax=Methylocystis parvus TaxID=134 RepID=A0A6B8MDQ2_9HYPH|nr:helix-turn-helix transcriptional regulator [Methylocystis parvus]
MDMRKLVGRNVRRIRLEKGLTQEEFAEKSGFTQQYLSGLERGTRNPTIVSLYEIALALGVEHVALVAPDAVAMQEETRRPKQGTAGTEPTAARKRKIKSPTLPPSAARERRIQKKP